MRQSVTNRLKSSALELGFELVGVAPAESPKTYSAFRRWLDLDMHAGMGYLAARSEARKHPKSILAGVRSIIMLGVSYGTVLGNLDGDQRHPITGLAGIAEYARGMDYHRWVRNQLKKLGAVHRELFPQGQCRGIVDTAPLMERQYAVDAGLGRIGKNTMLIHPQYGSKVYLAALLSSEELELTKPLDDAAPTFPCGDCQCCRQVCPTGALTEPFVLDGRLCLNYWTIEQRDTIPDKIRCKLGDRFFGCDACQQVCPWNQDVIEVPGGTIDPYTLDNETLRRIAEGSPLERMYAIHRQ